MSDDVFWYDPEHPGMSCDMSVSAHTEPCDASKRPFECNPAPQGVGNAAEIPVTPEMIAVGGDLLEYFTGGGALGDDLATRTYRAMAAVAPVELYREDEQRIATLEAENAALVGRVGELELVLVKVQGANLELVIRLTAMRSAATPPVPDPRTFPATALRPAKGDRRRVGG